MACLLLFVTCILECVFRARLIANCNTNLLVEKKKKTTHHLYGTFVSLCEFHNGGNIFGR